MSEFEQQLLKEVRDIKRRLSKIEGQTKDPDAEWIDEKTAMSITKLGSCSLKKMRLAGKLTWRARKSGRGIHYQKHELEKLFTQTTY